MDRRRFLARMASAGVALHMGRSWCGVAEPSQKPNILLVIADDTTWSDVARYGGENVATPTIDHLAAEGMRFRRAYVSMAMCVPCRHELYTGLYPMGSGACWNHSTSREGTESICHHLGGLGYRVGLAGKCHAEPQSVFPFERIAGFESNCVHKDTVSAADVAGITEFMTRSGEAPFCLAVGLVDSHIPWTTGAPEHIEEKGFTLPPTLPDLPAVRKDYVKYLAEVAELDRNVGRVLRALDDAGKRGNTIVVFSSEQGAQFPGAKWTAWEDGLRTALLVRWPGQVKAGSETDALVQYADVLPTLLEAAGGRADLDGTSFLGVLLGGEARHRDYAYAMHNNAASGPPYPVRSVADGRFRYIRNLLPAEEYTQRHMEETMHLNGHPYWQAWKEAAQEEGPARELYLRFRQRPAEEFYDTERDPHCLDNLAGRAEYASVKASLARALEAWMAAEGDPGAALDTPEAYYPRSVKRMREDMRAAQKAAETAKK
ncbi:MAG: sulfatase [Candidatus Hydrogenedentes bacterium]|nr:sulfatase [Candidatus Hydrogenedentota bacterium]